MSRWAIIALCLAPIGATGATLGEEDQITVNRLSQNDFEVVSGSFVGGNEYFWCGAASYVQRRQGKSAGTPIYIKRPIAAKGSGRKSVVFSTSSAGLPKATGRSTVTVQVAGVMLKAGKARSFCRDAFTRSTK
jgi:hypothetical protein